MDVASYGDHNTYNWTQEHLMNVLTKGHTRILKDPVLINAFRAINRSDFSPDNLKHLAFEDKKLSIGYDQVCSRPTEIARMINILKPTSGKKYLVIGTGSGYSSTLLGIIAGEKGKIYSLERNQYLAEFARENIAKYSNTSNVEVVFRDGTNGLGDRAPYDFIYSEIAFPRIPNAIKNQLTVNGRMVIGIQDQSIVLINRVSPSDFDEKVFPGYLFDSLKSGTE